MKYVLTVDGPHAGQVVIANDRILEIGEVVLLVGLSPRTYKIKAVIDAAGQTRHVACFVERFGDPTEAEIMRAIKVAIAETKLPRVTQ